jgi:hypothetical protein
MAINDKGIVALAIAATIALVAFGPMLGAVTSGTGSVDVTNETVTADVGSYVDLRGYDIDPGSETIEFYNESSDQWETATEGTDYEIRYEEGSVQALEGGEFSDGEEIRASYTYQSTQGSTTVIVGLIPLLVALFVMVVIANKVQNAM